MIRITCNLNSSKRSNQKQKGQSEALNMMTKRKNDTKTNNKTRCRNQKWTIKRNWQHWVQKTHHDDK